MQRCHHPLSDDMWCAIRADAETSQPMHSVYSGTCQCLKDVLHWVMLAGLPPHCQIVLEEFQLVLLQLREAVAAQEDPRRIAALDEKLYAVYTELSIVSEGMPSPAIATHRHDELSSQQAHCSM